MAGVRPDGSDAATPRLELPEPAHFAAGQYLLVRVRVDAAPKGVEQAYSVSSSPWPPSSEIEITVRDVPARVSPVLTRQVGDGDQLHLHGPFGALTWNEAGGGPLVMIGVVAGLRAWFATGCLMGPLFTDLVIAKTAYDSGCSACRRDREAGQIYARVDQSSAVDGKSGADQRFECIAGVPGIGAHGGDHPAAKKPEGDELTGGWVPLKDHFIPGRSPAPILHP